MITIRELVNEINNEPIVANYSDLETLMNTPIVPRKMIEVFIAKCESDIVNQFSSEDQIHEAIVLRTYAELLLQSFEHQEVNE